MASCFSISISLIHKKRMLLFSIAKCKRRENSKVKDSSAIYCLLVILSLSLLVVIRTNLVSFLLL